MTFRNRIWPGSAGGLTCSLPSCSSAPAPVPLPEKEEISKLQMSFHYELHYLTFSKENQLKHGSVILGVQIVQQKTQK